MRPSSYDLLAVPQGQKYLVALVDTGGLNVSNPRERLEPDLVADLLNAETEVDIFKIGRVVNFVEAAESIPDRLPHQERSRRTIVNPSCPVISVRHTGTFSRDGRRGSVGEEQRARLLKRAVEIEEEASDGRDIRMGLRCLDEWVHPEWIHDRVIVEEHDVSARRQ